VQKSFFMMTYYGDYKPLVIISDAVTKLQIWWDFLHRLDLELIQKGVWWQFC